MEKNSLTLLVPSYNGSALIKKNLSAWIESIATGDELLLIDDASSDATLQWLIEHFKLVEDTTWWHQGLVPHGYHTELTRESGNLYRGEYSVPEKKVAVTVFRNAKNRRFAATVNTGVVLAKSSWIFLCNTDVVPFPDCLIALRTYMHTDTIFGVGCLEHEGDGPVIGGKNKLWFERGLFQHARADSFESGATAWVSGGSGLFNRSKWLELSGFDKAYYPAYWEDVDISFRARKIGWKVLFAADAQVTHRHETTNAAVFGNTGITQMSWKNAIRFSWKNANFFQRIQFCIWLPYWLIKFSQQQSSL